MTEISGKAVLGTNCTPPAVDEFPEDFFTVAELQNGAIIIHILVTVYIFTAIAIICDGYFVPAVEKICHILRIPPDIGGATFMATATASPELFVNIVGTFITQGDIGLGTILGSTVFNILGVTACCGLTLALSNTKSDLDWWPLTRDSSIYGISVCLLIAFLQNEHIEWYEALTLVLVYVAYIVFLVFDHRIQKFVKGKLSSNSSNEDLKISQRSVENVESSVASISRTLEITTSKKSNENQGNGKDISSSVSSEKQKMDSINDITGSIEEESSLWKWPRSYSKIRQVVWVINWPINSAFSLTVPNCEKLKSNKWIPLAFVMCIIWIGFLSYILSWMITVIGDTFKIPDSVMGISFLAIGAGVPEAASSIVVVKKGKGAMGISNSLGSSTLDILLCLGLPWLIKAAMSTQKWVNINSSGLQFTTITLVVTLLAFYFALMFNKFRLDKWVGLFCLIIYLIFIVLASLIELNVFMQVNLPTCGR